MTWLLELLGSAAGSVIRLLLARWLNKDPEKEALHADLEAKEREAAALAAPDRPESAVLAELRKHEH